MMFFVYLYILYNLVLRKSQAHFTKIKYSLDSVTGTEFMIIVSKARDKKTVLDRNKKFVIICKKYGKGALRKAYFAFFILRKSANENHFLYVFIADDIIQGGFCYGR